MTVTINATAPYYVTEGENVTVTLTRSGDVSKAFTVQAFSNPGYRTAYGQADGYDYEVFNKTIAFDAGVTKQSFSFAVNRDEGNEPNGESLQIYFSVDDPDVNLLYGNASVHILDASPEGVPYNSDSPQQGTPFGSPTIIINGDNNFVNFGDNGIFNFAPVINGRTIAGTNRSETLYGKEDNDLITGGNGSDRLFGRDGDDILKGGNGNDRLYGGLGQDTYSGGKGKDRIYLEHDEAVDFITNLSSSDRIFVQGASKKTLTVSAVNGGLGIYDGSELEAIYTGKSMTSSKIKNILNVY